MSLSASRISSPLGRRLPALLLFTATCLMAACGPANERPVSGAVPGSRTVVTPPGVPPTLSASEALRSSTAAASPEPSPSAGGPSPAPSPAASPAAAAPSPSVAALPPIVRTIVPPANGQVAAGAVTVSAVLVGRGADLATATLSIDGADAGAQIDKRSPRDWTIRTSRALPVGSHTARVLVRDETDTAGGFTWQFTVGDAPEPPSAPSAQPAPATSPVPKPRAP